MYRLFWEYKILLGDFWRLPEGEKLAPGKDNAPSERRGRLSKVAY